ncbi:MAG: metallophosphoesterase [bacterium]
MLFAAIALSVLTLIYGYVGWRAIRPAPLRPAWKRVLWALLAILWILPPLPLLLRAFRGESGPLDSVAWVAYLGLGFFVLSFFGILAADVVRLTLALRSWLVRLGRRLFSGAGHGAPPADAGRRRVLAYPLNAAIVGVSATLAGYGLAQAIQWPELVRVRVPLPNLPAELEGFRIVQITDTHFGPMIKERLAGYIVDRTNELEPDLIAMTGDLVDGSVDYLKKVVAPLSSLAARQGKFFVTGNHEYYSGAEPWLDEIDRLGLQVLVNQHRVLQKGAARLLVAGVTDPQGGDYVKGHGTSVGTAIAGAGPADVKLLLAHQPRAIFSAAGAGFDLQLSGHTHGGQFYPFSFLVGLAQPYLKGLHLHDGTWIYVSRGTGFWGPPMRLGTHSEITLIELTAAKAPGRV